MPALSRNKAPVGLSDGPGPCSRQRGRQRRDLRCCVRGRGNERLIAARKIPGGKAAKRLRSLAPVPRAGSDLTLPFNPPQIGLGQAIILHGMFTRSLQTILCNRLTDLLALTSVWMVLGVTSC